MKKGRVFCLVLILVLGLFVSLAFISAGTLRVTEEHPFLVNGSWIDASQLKVGDILQTSDGKKVRITSVEDVVDNGGFEVYNLEASEYSNFVVDSGDGARVVVHNSGTSFGAVPRAYSYSNTPKGVIGAKYEFSPEMIEDLRQLWKSKFGETPTEEVIQQFTDTYLFF